MKLVNARHSLILFISKTKSENVFLQNEHRKHISLPVLFWRRKREFSYAQSYVWNFSRAQFYKHWILQKQQVAVLLNNHFPWPHAQVIVKMCLLDEGLRFVVAFSMKLYISLSILIIDVIIYFQGYLFSLDICGGFLSQIISC